MRRLGVATIITEGAYTALLLAWVHSVAQQFKLMPHVQADILFVHCMADVPTLRTIAGCATGMYPSLQVRLVGGCIDHPSRKHPHFVDAVRRNTGHARFLNTWARFHLWSLTEYEQILYMDADTVLLRPIDHLLESMAEPLRTGHVGCVRVEPREPCNSGVLLLRPSAPIFQAMKSALAQIAQVGGFVLSDQDFFSSFFADCLVRMNRTYNFADIKRGRPVPPEIHILHFQGKKAANKPIDYRAGGTLRYTRSAPEWPVFRVFESHFAPLYECYTSAAAHGGIAPLLPKAPVKYKRGLVNHNHGANIDRPSRKVVSMWNEGACSVTRAE